MQVGGQVYELSAQSAFSQENVQKHGDNVQKYVLSLALSIKFENPWTNSVGTYWS